MCTWRVIHSARSASLGLHHLVPALALCEGDLAVAPNEALLALSLAVLVLSVSVPAFLPPLLIKSPLHAKNTHGPSIVVDARL